jgi:hypothetical protein
MSVSSAGRKALALTLLLTLVSALLVPIASSQAPGAKVFTVTGTISPASTTITERFGSVTMFLNITVTATTQSAAADQATIAVQVTRDRPQPAPNGWVVSDLSESNFTLAPGQRTKSLQFTVSLTSEDPDERPVPIQFTIRARPSFPTSPLDPLTGQVSGNQEVTAQASGRVSRNLDPAEALTSFVFQNALLLAIAAAAILIVVGVLLRGRRKSGVSVTTDTTSQEVVPGRGASFPLVVTNLSGNKETVVLGTSDVPAGWSAILPVERLELRGSESTTIWLTLKSPANARPGESIQVAFIATGTDGTATETRLEASVVEKYGGTGSNVEDVEQAPRAARAR